MEHIREAHRMLEVSTSRREGLEKTLRSKLEQEISRLKEEIVGLKGECGGRGGWVGGVGGLALISRDNGRKYCGCVSS